MHRCPPPPTDLAQLNHKFLPSLDGESEMFFAEGLDTSRAWRMARPDLPVEAGQELGIFGD